MASPLIALSWACFLLVDQLTVLHFSSFLRFNPQRVNARVPARSSGREGDWKYLGTLDMPFSILVIGSGWKPLSPFCLAIHLDWPWPSGNRAIWDSDQLGNNHPHMSPGHQKGWLHGHQNKLILEPSQGWLLSPTVSLYSIFHPSYCVNHVSDFHLKNQSTNTTSHPVTI